MDNLYKRNLVKDKLQDYILNFVYNDREFKNIIFTGGTCLRKLYGLPRLSEDIDLDYEKQFDINLFIERISRYFKSLKPNFTLPKIKLAGNKKTVFFKFIKKDFLPEIAGKDEEIIFVRCDFSHITNNSFKIEILPLSSNNFSFFVKAYDLPTLFANKLSAFLERNFFKGKKQKIPFKGRDVFDIFWFIDLSAKSGFKLKPNWQIVKENFPQLETEKFIEKVIEKLDTIEKKDLINDIVPFIADQKLLNNFLDNFADYIKNRIYFLLDTK